MAKSNVIHLPKAWGNNPQLCKQRGYHDYDEVNMGDKTYHTCIDCGSCHTSPRFMEGDNDHELHPH